MEFLLAVTAVNRYICISVRSAKLLVEINQVKHEKADAEYAIPATAVSEKTGDRRQKTNVKTTQNLE